MNRAERLALLKAGDWRRYLDACPGWEEEVVEALVTSMAGGAGQHDRVAAWETAETGRARRTRPKPPCP